MKLIPNCRDTTRLTLLSQDQALPWHVRVRVSLHMKICKACPVFTRQVQLMQRATAHWRSYRDD